MSHVEDEEHSAPFATRQKGKKRKCNDFMSLLCDTEQQIARKAACSRLLVRELEDLTKKQIIEIVSQFCLRGGDGADKLLIQVQLLKDRNRAYGGRNGVVAVMDVQEMVLPVSVYTGPLAAHRFAMTSSARQKVFKICKADCDSEWQKRLRGWTPWQPRPCEEYYLWRLSRTPNDQRTINILKRLITADNGRQHSFGIRRQMPKMLKASRVELLRRVVTESSIDALSLGSALVKIWMSRACRQGLQILVEFGARVSKGDACRVVGVGRECDGIYVRGNTQEGIMGKVGATEEEDEGDEDICRLIDVHNNRWCITNCYTGVIFAFLDEIPECIQSVPTSYFLEEEDNEIGQDGDSASDSGSEL